MIETHYEIDAKTEADRAQQKALLADAWAQGHAMRWRSGRENTHAGRCWPFISCPLASD